jgi:hypothetical protein
MAKMSLTHKNCCLEYGTTRQVLLLGCLAIKVPNFTEWRLCLLGLLANMQEAAFSRSGWPELCPVIFSLPGGFLNVMKRAEPMTSEQFDEEALKKWVDRDGHTIPVEIKVDSFGYIDGELVAIDYGN